MHSDPRYFAGEGPLGGDEYDIGGGYPFDPNSVAGYAGYAYGGPNPPFGASLAGPEQHQFPVPLNNVEFQPSETCPKNFVIFDQTYNKSRVMFHSSYAHKFGSSSFNMYDTHASEAGRSSYHDNNKNNSNNDDVEEEIEDIDALLSSEEVDGEDDEVISTGRTPGKWGGSSSDTACSGKPRPNSDKRASGSDRKKERMKKMVKTLKGIVPGGERMDTPAVLDEAVKYLKSLKFQAKKLGVRNVDT